MEQIGKPIRMRVKFPTLLPAYLDAARAREIVYKANRITMDGAVNMLYGAVVENTPYAFGFLRASMFGQVYDVAGTIVGKVGTPSPYGAPVEFGSRPHWAPIGPLKLWAVRKHGDVRVAYIAQRAIARRGTKGAFMFRRTFNELKGRVRKLFADAQAATLKKLTERR